MKSATISLLQIIAATLILLFVVCHQAECVGLSPHEQTARLTTFGSQNTGPKNQSTAHPTQKITGKECRSDTDCAGIANTTCMKHPDDPKMRCFCGDRSSPVYGSCSHSKQGLHHKCSRDEECISGAACKAPNNSSSSSNTPRTCECKEGFAEEDHECSSGILTTVPCLKIVFLLLFYSALQLIH